MFVSQLLLGCLLLSTVSISSAWIFDCKFSATSWAIIGAVYQCYPKVSNPDNKVNLLSVIGNHLSGKTLQDVTALYIENQEVGYVPKDIELFFPNLKGLQFHVGYLLSISASDLEPFPNLIVLALARNKFTNLPGDLFKFTPKLIYIDVDNNQIQHVGEGLLENLHELSTGRFRNNPCINFYATNSAEVKTLKSMLAACPSIDPKTTTTRTSTSTTSDSRDDGTETCSLGCSEWIDSLECKVHDLEKKLRQVAHILKSV